VIIRRPEFTGLASALTAFLIEAPLHTSRRNFKKEGFTLKTHQMFSPAVQTTPLEFEKDEKELSFSD